MGEWVSERAGVWVCKCASERAWAFKWVSVRVAGCASEWVSECTSVRVTRQLANVPASTSGRARVWLYCIVVVVFFTGGFGMRTLYRHTNPRPPADHAVDHGAGRGGGGGRQAGRVGAGDLAPGGGGLTMESARRQSTHINARVPRSECLGRRPTQRRRVRRACRIWSL